VLGPEHEFSVVDDDLKALPIVDKIMKEFYGRIVNFVKLPRFSFGKELQMHVMEVKPNAPFESPVVFEETMQEAVLTLSDFLERRKHMRLLGTGMHPLVRLEETAIWPHRHRQLYDALSKVFDLKRHGWLNIQSFQLNLSYSDEESGVLLHNALANLCAYLPAVSAASPVYEGRIGENVDNRLHLYQDNEIRSITGDVVPEYVSSFDDYWKNVIGKYSMDMAKAGADPLILGQDWVNSRGVTFRFDRKALEIRVMDEQECIKTDVALSCFIRAAVKGLLNEPAQLLPHETLVNDFRSVVKTGLNATTVHPHGHNAREILRHFLRLAWENSSDEEKKYLPIVEKRTERGSLSEILRERIEKKAQRTDLREAIVSVYSKLLRSLVENQPYF
jgi:gamma-glutamyl:cysteine ligase YbdK (ATP-grasp superfamily)